MGKYKHVDGMEGLERALEELQELTGKSGKPILRRALVKSSHPIRDSAKADAPWPDSADEANIKAATSYIDSNGSRRRAKEPKTAVYSYVYDPHPLAAIFEFGTAERFQSNGKWVGSIDPQSYLRGATNLQFDKVINMQADLIGIEIKKAFEKHVKKGG